MTIRFKTVRAKALIFLAEWGDRSMCLGSWEDGMAIPWGKVSGFSMFSLNIPKQQSHIKGGFHVASVIEVM